MQNIAIRCYKTLAVVLLTTESAYGYRPGDLVSLMRRTQYSEQRTEWHEVPHHALPKFLRDSTTSLEALPADAPANEPFKISLALHGLQHVTTWITVSDGDHRFLDRLEVQLTAWGEHIEAVQWETQYVEGDVPPERIKLHWVWHEELEHDLAFALRVLFLLGASLVAGLAYVTCGRVGDSAVAMLMDEDEDSRSRGAELSHHARRHAGAPGARGEFYPGGGGPNKAD